jgi:membrane-associated phospholipid phosphatase
MVSVRPMAVAVCAAVTAAVVYAAMWLGYRQGWGWLDTLDCSSLTALYDVGVKHPGWVGFWRVVSAVFGPTTFRLLAALVVVALARRNVRAALFLVVSVQFSGRVTQVAKGLADRPRPTTALVAETSSSFPSGHALVAMVGCSRWASHWAMCCGGC